MRAWTVKGCPRIEPGLVAVLLTTLAVFFGAWSAQPAGAQPAVGGDPCAAVDKQKRAMRQKFGPGYRMKNVQCLPVEFKVVWELTETYRRRPPWGADLARIKLHESYTGYLLLIRAPGPGRRLRSFFLVGPSPCCPGRIETTLERGEARLLLCNHGARNCRMTQVTSDPLKFKVVPEDDTQLTFSWDRSGGARGGIESSNVYLHPAVIKPPRFKRPGILETVKGGSFQFNKKGAAAITLSEVKRGLERGVIEKVFAVKQTWRQVMGEVRSVQGRVRLTVRLAPEEKQVWLVTVRGWEIDRFRKPIWPKVPVGGKKSLPVAVRFDWQVAARFTLAKVKKRRWYERGRVIQAAYKSRLLFKYGQYYRCLLRTCPPHQTPATYVGAYLTGRVSGRSVKLGWVNHEFVSCLWCRPRMSYLGQAYYRQRFSAGELFGHLSRKVLPLKNGYRATFRVGRWLRYRLHLRRLK